LIAGRRSQLRLHLRQAFFQLSDSVAVAGEAEQPVEAFAGLFGCRD
jgi:hypothetical protein